MIRVIRVGGSLLTWDLLKPALEQWLAGQPTACNLLIAGGGPWVELLRQASDRFSIGEQSAHELCLKAMSVTAHLLAEIVDAPLISDLQRLNSGTPVVNDSTLLVLDAHDYILATDPKSRRPLPATWAVTSDSIAARICCALNASELVLLKSCDTGLEDGAGKSVANDWDSLAMSGHVDSHFPTAIDGIPNVSWVNLRTVL